MCPLCIGTALLLWSGTGSAGGVAAVTLRSIRRRRLTSQAEDPHRSPHKTGENVQADPDMCDTSTQSLLRGATPRQGDSLESLSRH
jgi:hypothetical protein